MDLFLDDAQGIAKFAQAYTRLSENPDDWQAEVINELYRQAPYVGDFEPKLVMNELDPERRYAMGSIELSSRTSTNPRDDTTKAAVQGVKHVMIPVIVKDGKMSPLDIFISEGKAQPLTQQRLNRAMFRPQLFEATAKRPGDQDMMNVLYPPSRSGGSGGNSRVGQHETAKTGSARMLIADIHQTIKTADLQRMEDALNDDPTLRAAIMGNPACLPFLQKLAEPVKSVSANNMWKQAFAAIPPKVVQIQKTEGGFLIKTANPKALAPEENKVDRPTAQDTVGEDLVRQVERDGTVTVSTEPTVRASLADARIEIAKEFGEYKVKTKDGNEALGWVFPSCTDLDGTNLAISLFSNGSQSGFQENIAGSLVGKGTNLIDEKPTGHGCFYLARQGGAVAIVPMDIKGEAQDTQGERTFMVKTIMGQEAKIRMVPGLSKIADMGNSTYGLPSDCGWIPMKNSISLAESADEYVKTAEALEISGQVELMCDGTSYSMRGLGLQKMASVLPTEFIDADQAVYNLAILGVAPSAALEKLAEAGKSSRWYAIDGVRPVVLAVERMHKAKTAAITFIQEIPAVKTLMLKEAAALDDPMSVDRVLSIGFLNPENIGTFVSYLPEFEDTLKKLSELLVAARLGAPVDSGALERVVKHLDKAISGLRELSQHPQA
ncbi:MAG: hypothetical protein KAY24_20125 [Candidatus Eisenbacteria sp.]|nr:hypothetical protein [Candidatus Eisenbacteria bacterium]